VDGCGIVIVLDVWSAPSARLDEQRAAEADAVSVLDHQVHEAAELLAARGAGRY